MGQIDPADPDSLWLIAHLLPDAVGEKLFI